VNSKRARHEQSISVCEHDRRRRKELTVKPMQSWRSLPENERSEDPGALQSAVREHVDATET